MSPEYAACSAGREQSPIDIPATSPVNAGDIAFNYHPSVLNIVNNGHTIQGNYDPGSSIEVDGTQYNLLQFHFHARSEHTFDGEHSDMEMHMVHQCAAGGYALVEVMLARGSENPAFVSVWEHLPDHAGESETIPGVMVNTDNMLPHERSYYRYNGSFTTPPCTEGVTWFMLNSTVELSEHQVVAFEAIYDDTYRPVQPFNDRAFLLTAALEPEAQPETATHAEPAEQAAAAEHETPAATALATEEQTGTPSSRWLINGLAALGIVGAGLWLFTRTSSDPEGGKVMSNWFNKLKIGTKLVGGFLIVILITTSALVMGILNMRQMGAETQDIVREAEKLIDLEEVQIDLLEQELAEKDYLLSSDPVFLEHHKEFEVLTEEVLAEAMSLAITAEDREAIALLEEEKDEYEETLAEVVALYD